MRRRARMLPTAGECIAMIRDVALRCVVFHTVKRGFELSVALASQRAYDPRRGAITRYEVPPKRLCKEEHRLPRNLRDRGFGRVPTGDGIHAMGTRRWVRVPVPGCSRRRGEGKSGADAGADYHHPPAHLRAAGMEDKRLSLIHI